MDPFFDQCLKFLGLLLPWIKLFDRLALIQIFRCFFFKFIKQVACLIFKNSVAQPLGKLFDLVFQLVRFYLDCELLSRFPHLTNNAERRPLIRDEKFGLIDLDLED